NKLSKEKFNVQLDYLALTILTITLTRVFIDPIYRFDQIIGNIDIPEKLNISYSYNLALILNATKIILIVPIVEEFVFRGIIL
ncbi:hypothetical protein J8281_19565, partial [Aquimarina sp. U1-2]|uniref:hypothetical protein n=1 Tax=Aquimarina sp. U1-2 TaxID=2823141 RepID=UPI001AECD079